MLPKPSGPTAPHSWEPLLHPALAKGSALPQMPASGAEGRGRLHLLGPTSKQAAEQGSSMDQTTQSQFGSAMSCPRESGQVTSSLGLIVLISKLR